MSTNYEPVVPTTEPEHRAERLGFALRRLAAELVDERRKVAELRRKVAQLKSRLESLKATPGGDYPEPTGADSRPRARRA